MALAFEAQLDAVMDQALAVHALGHAHLAQQVHRALLQHAGPNAGFDVRARTVLEDHRLDALQTEQLGQHQTGRTRADDGYLGAHVTEAPSTVYIVRRILQAIPTLFLSTLAVFLLL